MICNELIEISVEVDGEAAEAVTELFNRYNGGDWHEDSAAGEVAGGGAVVEATGVDDSCQPIPGDYQMKVKTYVKPGPRGQEIRRRIEEGLWRLSLLYPIPEPAVRAIQEEDWAHSWKKFYKPLRIGRRILLAPAWEEVDVRPDDILVQLEPGMAFGTGMHPTTRLCVAALEELVRPDHAVLDVGCGSGVLSIVAAKLGARPVVASDIDPLAVDATLENAVRNQVPVAGKEPAPSRLPYPRDDSGLAVIKGSVPERMPGRFQVVVANILAEVLVGLFDGSYENVPLAEPLADGGHMVLSGILEEKAEIVIQAARRHGLDLVGKKQEGDWVALIVRAGRHRARRDE